MSTRPPRLVRFALLLSLCFGPSFAQETAPASRADEIQQQRENKAKELKPVELDAVEKRLLRFENGQVLQRLSLGSDGFFPKLGGLATGQGLALGVQYNRGDLANGQIKFSGFAVGSLSKSQRYYLGVSAPHLAHEKLAWDAVAERRTLTRLDFYGLGPNTRVEDRTNFLLEDTAFDTSLTLKPVKDKFHIGARGGYLQNNTGKGLHKDFPSTEEVFSPDQIPGLNDQANFVRFGGFALLDFRDIKSLPRSGTMLRTDFMVYRDQTLGRHNFNQLELEVQQYIPFFNKRRIIALRARTELNLTAEGQSVPFYLKPWIGGPQELRGFRNYRFYDDNIFVLNAEYRWEIFSGLDGALFFDAGQAVPTRQDFDIAKMETAAGIGFRFNVRNTTILRLDTGFSNEGVKVWLRWGSPF